MKQPSSIEPNHRILVIDDNRAIHDDIRKILIGESDQNSDLLSDEDFLFGASAPRAHAGKFEIDSAYQGQEGLARVKQKLAQGSSYALAFVDVRMPPGWDGVETVTRLWEVDPSLQVVICTAYSDYSWGNIQSRIGPSDNLLILKKPFDNIEVIQLAHALTRKWMIAQQAKAKLEDLDLMVAKRTAELQATTDTLRQQFAERAKAEEAFRIVFEASPIGIALMDERLRFVSANSALEEIHDLTRDDIIGNDPVELGWFSTYDEFHKIIAEALRREGVDQHEIKLSDGARGARTGLLWARHVEIHGAQHVLCFLLDISERVNMERELRQARVDAEAAVKAKTEFLANMSHEIRTPLNGVLGLSSFLEEQTLPESVREMGKLIRTSGEMLRRVLDDVLDFSKIESGKLELEQESFSLRESLEWSLGIYQKAALDKQLQLTLKIETSERDRLIGDATRLRQVVTNLISNAVKFTEHGSIKVSAAVQQNHLQTNSCILHIAVSDTGIGIPTDRMDRLFRSFSQVDASTSRRFGGTGLGLAISKRLVEMMGGRIGVISQLGAGTTFSFTIPTSIAEPESTVSSKTDQRTISRRILVVEDNPVNCLVIRRMLERLGHIVDLVNDGITAVRRVQETDCSLVLMDVHMPGLDGLQATQQIRKLLTDRARIPVIALTASALVDDRQACLEAGMDDHLSKPINMEALRAIIDHWTSDKAMINRNSISPIFVQANEDVLSCR
jgi:PAS domain S-box-containing protein